MLPSLRLSRHCASVRGCLSKLSRSSAPLSLEAQLRKTSTLPILRRAAVLFTPPPAGASRCRHLGVSTVINHTYVMPARAFRSRRLRSPITKPNEEGRSGE
jgi:hypothetical protein